MILVARYRIFQIQGLAAHGAGDHIDDRLAHVDVFQIEMLANGLRAAACGFGANAGDAD